MSNQAIDRAKAALPKEQNQSVSPGPSSITSDCPPQGVLPQSERVSFFEKIKASRLFSSCSNPPSDSPTTLPEALAGTAPQHSASKNPTDLAAVTSITGQLRESFLKLVTPLTSLSVFSPILKAVQNVVSSAIEIYAKLAPKSEHITIQRNSGDQSRILNSSMSQNSGSHDTQLISEKIALIEAPKVKTDPTTEILREYSAAIHHQEEKREKRQIEDDRQRHNHLETIKHILHEIDGRCGFHANNPSVEAIIASLGTPYDSIQAAIGEVIRLQQVEEEERKLALNVGKK